MKRFRCLWVIGCLWFPLMGWAAPAPPSHLAQLSAGQQQWLAQHNELRVGLVLQAGSVANRGGKVLHGGTGEFEIEIRLHADVHTTVKVVIEAEA